jgi:GTP-binding protein
MAVEAGKGIMIVLNKTDLIDSQKKKEKLLEIQQQFLFCKYAPVLTVSTKTKEGLLKLFPMIDMIKRNRLLRVPTKELHHWLLNAISTQPMTALHSAKHITQTKDPPPSFVIFVRHPKYVQVSMLRYLDNRLRETFGLEGVPVRWIIKAGGGRRKEEE